MTAPFSQWRAPAPLWSQALADESLERLAEPAILRFTDPAFMEGLLELLAQAEPDLAPLVVRPESRRQPQAGWGPLAEQQEPLTLYQPAHGRYYLVAASLVQQTPGLPPWPSVPDGPDRFFCLVRRLVPDRAGLFREYAWLAGEDPGWVPASPDGVHPAEERLPLFQLPLGESDRLFVGMVPAASRQAYQKGWEQEVHEPAPDWRLAEFQAQVLTPLFRLQRLTEAQSLALSPALCLDLAAFLRRYLPGGWSQIPFDPEWRYRLELVWSGREAIVQGGAELPPLDLREALPPEDANRLLASLAGLLPPAPRRWPFRLSRSDGQLYVIRCVHERVMPFRTVEVLSEPTRPFHMAAYYDKSAPEPAPPGGPPEKVPLLVALIKYLIKWVFPPDKEG